MTQVITALYENGMLRPLTPLNLHERQRVQVQILPESRVEDEGEAAVRILVAAGLMRQPDKTPPPPAPLSDEERRALAEKLGRVPGKPLSEIVIEDRGPQ